MVFYAVKLVTSFPTFDVHFFAVLSNEITELMEKLKRKCFGVLIVLKSNGHHADYEEDLYYRRRRLQVPGVSSGLIYQFDIYI